MDKIDHIGIIGQGKMGTALFLYLLGYDYTISWLCSSPESRDKAQQLFNKKLRLKVHCGVMSSEESTVKSLKTLISDDPEILAGCDLIIETITEDVEKKKALFLKLDPVLHEKCLMTSNSSSILPSLLIPSEKRQKTFAGLHFLFPLNLKKTIELIAAPQTSQRTLDTLQQFLQAIDKISLQEHEGTAFIINKILLDFQAGAYQIFLEGKLGMKEIDALVKRKFFAIGVFEFFDHVGIDVMLASFKNYTLHSQNREFYTPLISKMEELVSANRLGIKTKRGFYQYGPQNGDGIDSVPPEGTSKEYLEKKEQSLRNYLRHSFQSAIANGTGENDLTYAMTDLLSLDKDSLSNLFQDNFTNQI